MSKNATTIAWEEAEKAMREKRLEARMMDFFERYSPEAPEEKNRFHYDLLTIVRTIYQEAAAPADARLMKFVEAMPIQPFLLKPDKA